MLRSKSLLAKFVAFTNWNIVVDKARMNLLNSRLVLESLPVSLDMLRSSWLVSVVDIAFQAILCSFTSQSNDSSSSPDVRDWILTACFS